jgi:zinc protease
LGDYRNSLIRSLSTSMLGQRLQELTQKANPPFVFGVSSLGSFVRGYEGYSSGALLSKGGAEPAIHAIIQENERARKFGFTESELDRTKKMMLKSIERSYNEREKTESAGLANELIRNFLQKEPIPGIANEYKYYNEFLKTVTLAEVNDATKKIIPPSSDSKLIIFTGPIDNQFKVPTKEELVALAENAAKIEIKPYEEKAVASTLMEKKPAAGTIKEEKELPGVGVTSLTFANGVKVLLKPTDFKNDQVIMSASRFGGQYNYDPKERSNAEYAATVVGQMGVAEFSPVDLRKVLAGKTASVSPRISQLSEGMNGQCGATDVETMLQLTHLYFTNPRQDPELFNSFVTKQQALYQNALSDPQYIFQDSILKILYKNHAWAPRLPKVETFNQINQDRAVQIYKERFGNANGFTFVLVGKFDVATIKPLLATYIGSLPSTGATSTFKDVGLRASKGPLKKEVKKGTEPKSVIRLYWNGETTYSDEEQFRLQAFAELMNIKLIETLREDLGGIYGGGMSANLSKNPYGNYTISVTLPCGPENVDKLVAATIAEIDKVRKSGPTEADLSKVKETWKQQYLVNVKDNNYWARQLLQGAEMGTNPANILEFEKRTDALTVKQLQDIANKYLDTKNFVQIVLNPELSEKIETK